MVTNILSFQEGCARNRRASRWEYINEEKETLIDRKEVSLVGLNLAPKRPKPANTTCPQMMNYVMINGIFYHFLTSEYSVYYS